MKMKKVLILNLIFLTSFAFANTTPQTPSQTKTAPPKPKTYQKNTNLESLKSDQCFYPMYNAPARIDVQAAWNFIVSASFIYWQPEMVGIDLGYRVSTDLSSQPHSVVNLHNKYRPGFKVLLGTHYDYDDWNINARYTRFHARDRMQDAKGDILFHFFDESTNITSIDTRWRPHIDYFDLEVGRPYYNGKHLLIKPSASVKGGWSKQTFTHNVIINELANKSNFETKSWFLGPRGVLDIHWLLTYDFRLFLNSSVSLMYQKFKTKDRFTSAFVPLTYSRRFDAKSIQLTPTFDLNPGFGWSSYFDHNNWHVDLFASYNFLYLFNQNEFTSVDALGDLMFHGLEISLKFDF